MAAANAKYSTYVSILYIYYIQLKNLISIAYHSDLLNATAQYDNEIQALTRLNVMSIENLELYWEMTFLMC